MPMTLEGSCRCAAVSFSVESHVPQPYMRCYCKICRKTAGGGGYAINLGGAAETLKVDGPNALNIYRAEIVRDGVCRTGTSERSFCTQCASALWAYDPTWPLLIHPFASAIDTQLPTPPETVHIMLAFKPDWVRPHIGPGDQCFEGYPTESIDDWHKSRGLWVA